MSSDEAKELVSNLSAITLKPRVSMEEYKVIRSVRVDKESVTDSEVPQTPRSPVHQVIGVSENVSGSQVIGGPMDSSTVVTAESCLVSKAADVDRKEALHESLLWSQARYRRLAGELERLMQSLLEPNNPAASQIVMVYNDIKEQLLVEGKNVERFAEAYVTHCRADASVPQQVLAPVKVQEKPAVIQHRWYSLPLDYPKLDVHREDFNVVEYLHDFEQHVIRFGAHPQQFAMLLRQSVDVRDKSVDDFIHGLLDKPWEQVKQAVIMEYERQSAKATAIQKLALACQEDMPIGGMQMVICSCCCSQVCAMMSKPVTTFISR